MKDNIEKCIKKQIIPLIENIHIDKYSEIILLKKKKKKGFFSFFNSKS